jgi:hypothetical protein
MAAPRRPARWSPDIPPTDKLVIPVHHEPLPTRILSGEDAAAELPAAKPDGIIQPSIPDMPRRFIAPAFLDSPDVVVAIKVIAGLFMLLFGIWNAGGFYESGSRLKGFLATVFYTWQVGNILEIAGVLLLCKMRREIVAFISSAGLKVARMLWRR